MKSKKGQVFSAILLIVFILTMLYALARLSGEKAPLTRKPAGMEQLGIINMYYEGEKVQNYIDSAAILALNDAMHEFAETGGASDLSPCKTYLGYTVWDDNCKPSFESFKDIYNDKIYGYLSAYPIPDLPFEITADDSRLAGISKEYLDVNLLKPEIRSGQTQQFEITADDIELNPLRPKIQSRAQAQRIKEATVVVQTPSLAYSGEGIVEAKYSYDDCTAFDWFQNGRHTTREQFNAKVESGEFASIDSAVVDFTQNPKTNVMANQLAVEVLEVARVWNTEQGGNARISVSSACTGKHSANSWHNVGRAVDINGCYDSAGKFHPFKCVNLELTKEHEDFKCSEDDIKIATKCYNLFKWYYELKHFTNFIGPLKCTEGMCSSHYHHLHLEK